MAVERLGRGTGDADFVPSNARRILPVPSSRPHLSKRRVALGAFAGLVLTLTGAYTQKDRYGYRIAEIGRDVIGDENMARVESFYLSLQDETDKLKFRVFGGRTTPFSESQGEVAEVAKPAVTQDFDPVIGPEPFYIEPPVIEPPLRPAPLLLPETKVLSAKPEQGEGVWTTEGLPHSSPEDTLMEKTFFRPDKTRHYALVGVLLLDKRRIQLHITGGTEDPGGDLGVKGPGVIPESDRNQLLVAWNGGFRGPHGGFGMYADGKFYRPLRNGLASVVVRNNGEVSMGQWGRDFGWDDNIVAVRQNAVLLVDNCEVSKRTNEGNDTWGYVQVNSSEFITWRSAVGLTKDGDLLVAAGNSLSADSLARSLWAAGACYAMELDINTPYVLTSLFFPKDDGSLKPVKFMDSMVDNNPGRFLQKQSRDFMYVTLDETNFKP